MTAGSAPSGLFWIDYESPWERLAYMVSGIRRDNTLRFEIPENPTGWRKVLDRLADFCDDRDRAWRERHLAKHTRPRAMWRRSR